MNKKLESIKPYVKWHLQHTFGQPVKDSDVDVLCNKNGTLLGIVNVGEGYVLRSEVKLMKREDIFKEDK